AQLADDLHGEGVDVVLDADVADYAVRAGVFAGDLLDAARRAGDEGHSRATPPQLAHQGQPQPRGAAGDGDSQAGERIGGVGRRQRVHGTWLLSRLRPDWPDAIIFQGLTSKIGRRHEYVKRLLGKSSEAGGGPVSGVAQDPRATDGGGPGRGDRR